MNLIEEPNAIRCQIVETQELKESKSLIGGKGLTSWKNEWVLQREEEVLQENIAAMNRDRISESWVSNVEIISYWLKYLTCILVETYTLHIFFHTIYFAKHILQPWSFTHENALSHIIVLRHSDAHTFKLERIKYMITMQ